MKKRRVSVPKGVADAVMEEWRHDCALCGVDYPQIHHMDENPSNNEQSNLIPLCANCHITDQHNPTRKLHPAKLKLFREYKDPAILMPQFDPLFVRMNFLLGDMLDTAASGADFGERAADLQSFVESMNNGSYYARRLSDFFQSPPFGFSPMPGDTRSADEIIHAARVQHDKVKVWPSTVGNFVKPVVEKIEGLKYWFSFYGIGVVKAWQGLALVFRPRGVRGEPANRGF